MLDVARQADTLLELRDVKVSFTLKHSGLFGRSAELRAVDGVSLVVHKSQTMGIVGESGSGKTTLALAVARLVTVTDGQIDMNGVDLLSLNGEALRKIRHSMQFIFQDPYSSLNPRLRASKIVRETLDRLEIGSASSRDERVKELFDQVGLRREQLQLFPHQFSGGQRQRIGIARALALNPKVIALDEPVSALDVSIRAQIMNLLVDLQEEHGLAYLLVAHNLATVRYMCHDMAVMYLGVVQESGETEAIFNNPMHIYTNALVSAALPSHPDIQREEFLLPGEVVSPINPPPGDVFMTRTPLEVDPNHQWANERPPLVEKEPGHWVVETPWSMAADAGLKVELTAHSGV